MPTVDIKSDSSGPLQDFFEQYDEFEYDPTESASQQFHRLQREENWRRGDPEQEEAWEGYLKALVGQFNTSYGTDANDLTAWHELLAHIGITDLPETVRECKRVIRGKFINLVDLVDARDDPTRQIRHFPSEVALSRYTLEQHKVFPRNHVDAGSLLKYLLRNIQDPDSSRRDPSLAEELEEDEWM